MFEGWCEKLSYARWAAYEIMERLNDEAERLPPHITGSWKSLYPQSILSQVLDDLECYSYDGCSEKHEQIFSVAKKLPMISFYYFVKRKEKKCG